MFENGNTDGMFPAVRKVAESLQVVEYVCHDFVEGGHDVCDHQVFVLLCPRARGIFCTGDEFIDFVGSDCSVGVAVVNQGWGEEAFQHGGG